MYKFEIKKDKAGKFRFHFIAPNGKIMFQSQSYAEKHSAKETIASIKKHAFDAAVIDEG